MGGALSSVPDDFLRRRARPSQGALASQQPPRLPKPLIDHGGWRHILTKAMHEREPIVIHTLIFPENMDPFDANLKNCHVLKEQRMRYSRGMLPATELDKSDRFMAYIDRQAVPIASNIAGQAFIVYRG